jgi:hypothetical protein
MRNTEDNTKAAAAVSAASATFIWPGGGVARAKAYLWIGGPAPWGWRSGYGPIYSCRHSYLVALFCLGAGLRVGRVSVVVLLGLALGGGWSGGFMFGFVEICGVGIGGLEAIDLRTCAANSARVAGRGRPGPQSR